MKMSWRDGLTPNLQAMGDRVRAAVMMLATTDASIWEFTAKKNRPWTDRTGNAKKKLHAFVSQPDDKTVRITLAHGVPYGVDLEYSYGEKYKIIRPTIEQLAPKTMQNFYHIMDRVKE